MYTLFVRWFILLSSFLDYLLHLRNSFLHFQRHKSKASSPRDIYLVYQQFVFSLQLITKTLLLTYSSILQTAFAHRMKTNDLFSNHTYIKRSQLCLTQASGYILLET